MSYDENFKKWQKSRESKTPGGVKIGIFRFIAVLLFGCTGLTFNYSAWAVQCSNYDESTDTGCDASHHVAGCYYDTNDGCRSCNERYYCDGRINEEKSCSSYAGADYPYSAAGAKSKYECYKKLNGQTGNGYGSMCQNSTGTDITYSDTDNTAKCRQYYRESGTFVSCNGDTGTNDNGYVNNPATSDYHIEGTGDNAKCYSNTRNCNLFTTGNVIVHGVEGQALWDNTERKWKVYNSMNQAYRCKKTETNIEIRNFFDNHGYCEVNCNATRVMWPSSGTMVDNATDNITYNDIGNYFCTSCIDDENVARVPTAPTEFIGPTLQNCVISSRAYCSSNNAKSCRCKPVPRGYYKSQNNCSWDNNTDTLPNCTAACGPGKTTDGGATSEADCHYTTKTRFCDAHGCFYLNDLSWDATNHTYNWNGETSTSPGSN